MLNVVNDEKDVIFDGIDEKKQTFSFWVVPKLRLLNSFNAGVNSFADEFRIHFISVV